MQGTQNISAGTAGKPRIPGNQELLQLLADPNEYIASMAMDQILNGEVGEGQRVQLFRDNQDCDDTLLRRRLQQLGAAVQMIDQQKAFVASLGKSKTALLSSMIALDRIYNPKSSGEYLMQLMRDLYVGYIACGDMNPADAISIYMKSRHFSVPPLPWLNIGLFLIGDVLENCTGVPHIMVAIAAAVAHSQSIETTICMSDGHIGLRFDNGDVVNPAEDWKVRKDIKPSNMHLCSNLQVVKALMNLALSTTVATWNAYDAHIFASLLTALEKIPLSTLPYPYGDTFRPQTGKEASQ